MFSSCLHSRVSHKADGENVKLTWEFIHVNNISKEETLLSHLSHVTWMQHQCSRLWLLWTNWHSVILHGFKCVSAQVFEAAKGSVKFLRLPAVNITAGEQVKCPNWCTTLEGAVILLTRDVVEVKAAQLTLSAVWVQKLFSGWFKPWKSKFIVSNIFMVNGVKPLKVQIESVCSFLKNTLSSLCEVQVASFYRGSSDGLAR